MSPARTQRRRVAIAVAAAAVLLAACNGPYDLTGSVGADRVYVDGAGAWRVAGTGEVVWTGPSGSGASAAPGNYDGEGRWEPAVVDIATGTWTTAGGRGTFVFPPPTDDWATTPYRTSIVVGDYDGDGDTDPAYFSPDTAVWMVEGQPRFVWGRPTTTPGIPLIGGPEYPMPDIPAPADYDGDGDTDPAVYRLETGEFLVKGQGTIRTTISYGQPVPANYTAAPGDEAAVMGMHGQGWAVEGEADPRPFAATISTVATPADEDGDGTVELGAVSPGGSNSVWEMEGGAATTVTGSPTSLGPRAPLARGTDLLATIFASNGCVLWMSFGCPGHPPTVVSSTSGAWSTTGSISGTHTVFAGRVGATPVMGDLDGDGTEEHAAYDPATGEWVTDGDRATFTYAAPADVDADPSTAIVPLVLDHDGDGDADPAFFREADATWFLEGSAPIQFGRPTSSTPTFGGTPVHDLAVPGDLDGDGDDDLAVYRIDTGAFVVRGGATIDPGWPAGHPLVGDHDGDGDDEPGLYDATTGTWYRQGRAPATPFPLTGGLPLLVQSDGDATAEMSLAADPATPGASRIWWFEWRPPGSWQSPTLPADLTPALGRNETRAADSFVRAYLAACVVTSPPPGECT